MKGIKTNIFLVLYADQVKHLVKILMLVVAAVPLLETSQMKFSVQAKFEVLFFPPPMLSL